MSWIDVNTQKPPMNVPILVKTGEFGFAPTVVIARFWQSTLPGQPMKFYLDNDTYKINGTCYIAEQVVAWQPIPEVKE